MPITRHRGPGRCLCVPYVTSPGARSGTPAKSGFILLMDEEEGAAVRACTACSLEHPIGDSAEYLNDADLGECGCPCGAEGLELTVGVALYAESTDVRWLYIGARCPKCSIVGCYGDWKNEYIGYQELLSRV